MRAGWMVYIIECLDGSYYVGMSSRMSDRFEQHQSRYGSKYTAKHGVKAVAHLERYETFDEARTRERQLKGWTRVKKERLIRGEWRQM